MHWSYVRYTVYMLLSKGGRVPPVRTYSQRLLLSTQVLLLLAVSSSSLGGRNRLYYSRWVLDLRSRSHACTM